MTLLYDYLAGLLVLLGLAGVILPVLPGAILIFLGALLYDFAHGWIFLGPLWLGVLLGLALLSEGGDWWLGQVGARKGGASGRALVVGTVAGFLGLILFPPFGFLIGSIGGVAGVELLRARDPGHAARAGGGWFVGWLLSLLLQAVVAVAMVAILLWRVA